MSNPGFENVLAPCGMVPPNGLINGSFNQGCMDGWFAAWGTPSVCSNNPYEGDYYACLGANNEGFYQDVALDPDNPYCLSFRHRNLNGGAGSLDVYLANGLTNQSMSNSGYPPLVIDPGWQLLGSFSASGSGWEEVVISSFTSTDPANNQLLFLDVPSGSFDVGIDDVLLTLTSPPDPDVVLEFECVQQDGNEFVFEGSLEPLPSGWENATWNWNFGDGQSGAGQTVTHTFDSYGTYEICLTVSAECGCAYSYCMPFVYDACLCNCGPDNEPPVWVTFDPGPLLVFCEEDIPAPEPPVITDCDPSASVSLQEVVSGPVCDRLIQYIWTAIDACGNTTVDTQVILFTDNTPPFFLDPPVPLTVSCENAASEFSDWLDDYGGAQVINSCDGDITLSFEYDNFSGAPCGTIDVQFFASDACGNVSNASATFTITDVGPPEWVVFPSDLSFLCAEPDVDLIQTWLDQAGGGLLSDNCSNVSVSYNYNGELEGDSIEVVFSAEDECFQTTDATAWIIIQSESDTLVTTTYTCDPAAAAVDSLLEVEGTCTFLFVDITQLLPSDTILTEQRVCDAAEAGADTLYAINVYGCDSLVILKSVFISPDTVRVFLPTCKPGEVMTDTLRLLSVSGCDSLLTITSVYYDFNAPDTVRLLIPTCNAAEVTSDTARLVSVEGCDSLLTVTSVYLAGNQIEIFEDIIVCGEGQSYRDTTVVPGPFCDTLKVFTYLFDLPDTTLLVERVCAVVDSGTTEWLLSNQAGCDSLVILLREYLPPAVIVQVDSVCTGPDFIEESVVPDQFGCDSLIVISQILNIAPDTQFVLSFTCDSSTAGLFIQTVPGPFCDTITVVERLWVASYLTFDTIIDCRLESMVIDTLQYVSAEGCDSVVIVIQVGNSPQASVSIWPESCADLHDGRLSVDSVWNGSPPYSWSLSGGPFTMDSILTLLPPGKYNLVVRDSRGCTDTLTGLLIQPGQDFYIEVGEDQEVLQGSIVALNATAPYPVNEIAWTANDPIDCFWCISSLLGPVSTDQWAKAEAWSDAGCLAADSLRIRVIPGDTDSLVYYIPNVFSPNGDGLNDLFFLLVSTENDVSYDMTIYDRWGGKLFYTSQATPNLPVAGWNGTDGERDCGTGVYVYSIVIREPGGKLVSMSGDVTLIR